MCNKKTLLLKCAYNFIKQMGGTDKCTEDMFILEKAITNARDGIIITNDRGYIQVANPSFIRMFESNPEDIIGKRLESVIPNFFIEEKCIDTRFQQDLLVKKKNGEDLPIEISAGQIVVDNDRKFFGAIIRDITDRKKEEESLKNYMMEAKFLRNEAEKANRFKNEFLATMSHKMRTPMSDIIGIIGLLDETKLDDKQKRYSQTVMRSSRVLMNIINNVLDLIKIETGDIVFENTPFNLKSLLQELASSLREDVKEKNIELRMEYNNAVPFFVVGDKSRIHQVIYNLVNNAIKFTKKGGVTIAVDLLEHKTIPQNRVKIKISVKDTGSGVPLDVQNELFSKFAQVDDKSSHNDGGFGLGLAVSKGIVELMDGEINFESAEHGGSTFWVELDLLVSREEDIVQENQDENDFSKMRVLLVEDNVTNKEIEHEILNSLGINVSVATNGKEAIKLIKEHNNYDMVLMDCHMPNMDGYEATRKIRVMIKNREVEYVPIVAMTAKAIDGDKEKCLNAGMDDYISKPFYKKELLEVINRWNLGKNGIKSCAIISNIDTNEDNSNYVDFFSIETMKDLMGGKYVEMLKQFVHGTDDAIITIANSFEGELNLETIIVESHSLKSSCAYMGAKDTSAIAKELEISARSINGDMSKKEEMTDIFNNLEKSWQKVRGIYMKELNKADGDIK